MCDPTQKNSLIPVALILVWLHLCLVAQCAMCRGFVVFVLFRYRPDACVSTSLVARNWLLGGIYVFSILSLNRL